MADNLQPEDQPVTDEELEASAGGEACSWADPVPERTPEPPQCWA